MVAQAAVFITLLPLLVNMAVLPEGSAAARVVRGVSLGGHRQTVPRGAPVMGKAAPPLVPLVVLAVVHTVTVRTVFPATMVRTLRRIPVLAVLVVLRLLVQRLRMAVPVVLVTAFYIGWFKWEFQASLHD
jgi:hypothetical protein